VREVILPDGGGNLLNCLIAWKGREERGRKKTLRNDVGGDLPTKKAMHAALSKGERRHTPARIVKPDAGA